MKPGFALSLSVEGIALLHRSADGWRVIGDVSLDADDLTETLETLRQRALEIDPRGPVCKLVIPNDQIRYLSVEATATDDDGNRQLALAALATATPYSLDELAFDLSFVANQTHVAAVARATLAEAEQFATEHGFEPVSFVAIPDALEFDGEPYFGATSRVADEDAIKRDQAPITVIGMAADPAPKTAPLATVDDPTEPAVSDTSADTAPASTPFTSRRSKDDEPSTAPPLAGATRHRASEPPAEPAEPEPALAEPTETVAAAPNESPDKQEPDKAAEEQTTAPEPVSEKPSKPAIIRSERTTDTEVAPAVPAATQPEFEPKDEAARLTVFGAREQASIGGKPRHLGLILMAALLLFLAGVATWATLFLEDGLAGLFDDPPAETVQIAAPVPQAPDVQSSAPTSPPTVADTTDQDAETARIDPELTPNSADTATPGTTVSTTTDDPQTLEQDNARYAATGIWQRAPDVPETPDIVDLNNLYEVSIDRTDLAQDAVALPSFSVLDSDQPLDSVTAPAAAGTTFALDADGLVIPSPQGTLTPEGIRVYQGKPPVTPPPTPTRFEAEPDLDAGLDRLAGLRPKLRPSDLVEQTERTQLGGLTRAELGQVRPKSRPRTQKQEAERDETPTAQAVVLSKTPKARPRNFGAKVETARKKTAGPSTQVAVATVAPRTVSPKIPSSASVARRATLDNAINLRRINLIGVYGTPSNRRALVRLPSGRYKKVKVGDRVDGGKIVAIGDSELRYQKSGRNVTLKMPRG